MAEPTKRPPARCTDCDKPLPAGHACPECDRLHLSSGSLPRERFQHTFIVCWSLCWIVMGVPLLLSVHWALFLVAGYVSYRIARRDAWYLNYRPYAEAPNA